MNLLLTTFEFPPDVGGVGTSVNRIAHSLSQAGEQVTVVIFDDPLGASVDTTVTCEQRAGFVVYRIHPSTVGLGSTSRAAVDIPAVDSLYYEALGAIIKKVQPDILHGFYLSATGLVTTLIGKEQGIPVIVSIRGDDMMQELFMGKWFGMLQYVLENASMVISVSQDTLSRAQNIAAITSPTKVIWNSLSPVSPAVAVGLPSGFKTRPIIATAGNLRRNKGVHKFLADVESLEQPISFLLIGDIVQSEKEFWQGVLQNLPPHVTFYKTGLVSQAHVRATLKLADIAVFPSIRDGCPNAMIEAMSVGLPIIGSTAGAIGDIITAADCGIVLNSFPLETGHYRAALQSLLNDPARVQQFGANAKRFVDQQLTSQEELIQWRACYTSMIE